MAEPQTQPPPGSEERMEPEPCSDMDGYTGSGKRAGQRAFPLPADLAQESDCVATVEQAVAALGGLDVLVNNVACQCPADSLEAISTQQWERTFHTNVFSFFWTTKAALRHLPDGGAIVNTSSINGLRGNKTLIDYSATKGAVLAWTYSLAQGADRRRDAARVDRRFPMILSIDRIQAETPRPSEMTADPASGA